MKNYDWVPDSMHGTAVVIQNGGCRNIEVIIEDLKGHMIAQCIAGQIES